MAYTENRYTVLWSRPSAYYVDPTGYKIYCRTPEVAAIFKDFTWWYHNNIERIVRTSEWTVHCWRKGTAIHGTNIYSNHCAGMAIDIMGGKHPYEPKWREMYPGVPYDDGFTPRQRAMIRAKVMEYNAIAGAEVFEWGRDFKVSGRADGMHYELQGSWDAIKRLAAHLEGKGAEKRPTTSRYVAPFTGGVIKVTTPRQKGKVIGDIQRFFNGWKNYKSVPVAVDEIYGPGTEKVVKEFQERSGLTPDGVIGRKTRRTMAKYGLKI